MKASKLPNIAAECARHRMSREDLAKALGVSRKTLYNWENKGEIPPDKLITMARLFNATPEYLTEKS